MKCGNIPRRHLGELFKERALSKESAPALKSTLASAAVSEEGAIKPAGEERSGDGERVPLCLIEESGAFSRALRRGKRWAWGLDEGERGELLGEETRKLEGDEAAVAVPDEREGGVESERFNELVEILSEPDRAKALRIRERAQTMTGEVIAKHSVCARELRSERRGPARRISKEEPMDQNR